MREVGLADRFPDQDRGHLGRVAIAGVDGGLCLVVVRDAQEDELGLGLRQRLAEARDVPYPAAVNGLPRVAEGAVDDLDRVLLPGEDDERDGAGFGQAAFLGGPGSCGPATGAKLRGDYSTGFPGPNVTQVAASQSLYGPISSPAGGVRAQAAPLAPAPGG